MANIPFIEDAYIDDIIKSAGTYDPSINTTQGVKLRELIKLIRDRVEQGEGGKDLPKTFNYTMSGDGVSTVFRIPTGLLSPTVAVVSASSADARGKWNAGLSAISVVSFYSMVDGTDIVVTYPFAPLAGTNNLIWSIFVK